MAISLTERLPRSEVAWLGADPPPDATGEFAAFELILNRCESAQLADAAYLGNQAAVIIELDIAMKLTRMIRHLDDAVESLLDHGCEVVVVASEQELPRLLEVVERHRIPINGVLPDETLKFDWQTPKTDQLAPSLSYYYRGTAWIGIARLVAARRISDRPNLALKLTGGAPLERDLPLVRRAFERFTSVHLTPLDDGYSGARVFKAQAESSGGKPIPYFLKIGPRKEILEEYNGYLIRVEPFVPFHLAPALQKESCCLGGVNGLISGHYVTESESLLDCAEAGRAISPIACLFSRTLNAWHRPTQIKPLAEFVGLKIPNIIDPVNFAYSQKLGETHDVSDLRVLFDSVGGPMEVRYGWIHGDLHARNVRVRGSDAVIIDMGKHSSGPLLWDPACLEASLLTEGFTSDDRDQESWYAAIRGCFSKQLFDFWSHEHLTDSSTWFHVAINQIRLYVRAMEIGPGEYAAALAAALLWKASKGVTLPVNASEADREAADREAFRRGAAYLIAQHLLEGLSIGEYRQEK